MLDLRLASRQITFSGVTQVAPLADKQSGPTCGFEAVENIIQLFHTVGNDLVEKDLLPRAIAHKVAVRVPEGFSLDLRGYQLLLGDYGIPARWYYFDHLQVVVPALWNNRGVLVVGDAHHLNPQMYPQQPSYHAFAVTNYYTEQSGYYLMGYVGIDSNVAKTEVTWPYLNIQNAAAWAAQKIGTPVLITDFPFNWPNKAKYYRMSNEGHFIPVP